MQIISYIFILSFLKFQFRSADDEISKQDFFCRIPVLGLGLRVDFTFAWDNNNNNKLGLSWANLSYQLGFCCNLLEICCIIFITTKQYCLVWLQLATTFQWEWIHNKLGLSCAKLRASWPWFDPRFLWLTNKVQKNFASEKSLSPNFFGVQ